MLLYRLLHAKRQYLRGCLDGSGLGTGQPRLLVYLRDHEFCNQKELAEHFELDPSAVSRMLRSMERSGFVLCETDRKSRRNDRVAITEKGREYAGIWMENYRKLEELMLQDFSGEEKAQFAEYLRRAYENILKKGEGKP